MSLARLHPRTMPNPCARPAAWTRLTGGHGRRLTGRSEPLHQDGIASRIAHDHALTPAPAPLSPRASHFRTPPHSSPPRGRPPLSQPPSSPAPPCLRPKLHKLLREPRLDVAHLRHRCFAKVSARRAVTATVVLSVLVGARGRADHLAPLLLSSFEQHHRVRFFLAVLVRAASRPLTTGDGRWPLATAAPPRCRGPERRRGRPPSPPRPPWTVSDLGPGDRAGRLALFPTRSAQTKSGRGPVVLAGRASGNENWFSIFFCYLRKELVGKNVCVHILALKMVKQILY
jgi:hypothetical protein